MNRVLKFRVWDKVDKCFIQSGQGLGFVDLAEFECGNEDANKNNPNFVFQQFTGLKDKNGKEIYEGDIVKYYYYNQNKRGDYIYNGEKVPQFEEVKIDSEEYCGAYYPFTLSVDGQYGISETTPSNCEIVGNIFQTKIYLKLNKKLMPCRDYYDDCRTVTVHKDSRPADKAEIKRLKERCDNLTKLLCDTGRARYRKTEIPRAVLDWWDNHCKLDKIHGEPW